MPKEETSQTKRLLKKFGALPLYKFGPDEHHSYAIRLDKNWLEEYGLEFDEKLWVLIEYKENQIIITAVDLQKLNEFASENNAMLKEPVVEEEEKEEKEEPQKEVKVETEIKKKSGNRLFDF